MRRSLARRASRQSVFSGKVVHRGLAVAPSHLQLERRLLLNSRWALRRLLRLAPGYWRLAFRLQLRQLELDGGYGLFNRFELFADAFDGFLVTHRSSAE